MTSQQTIASSYPLLVDGIVTAHPYGDEGDVCSDDIVMVSFGECEGHVGRVTAVHRANSVGRYVRLEWLWPRNTRLGTEHQCRYLWKVDVAVPAFTSPAEADLWMERALPLREGQRVHFQLPITQVTYEVAPGEITYEGTLTRIDYLDIEYWWRNRPMATGTFEVLWIDSDAQPHLLRVPRVVRA